MRFSCRADSGERGVEGRSRPWRYATRQGISRISAICLGMQMAVIEFGRHVLGLEDANSTEMNRATRIRDCLITEWQDAARGVQQRDETSAGR